MVLIVNSFKKTKTIELSVAETEIQYSAMPFIYRRKIMLSGGFINIYARLRY